MKKVFHSALLIGASTLIFSCGPTINNNPNIPADGQKHAHAQVSHYGDEISEEGAEKASSILAKLVTNDSLVNVKMEAEIEQVCQMKGCWMKLKTDGAEPIRVTFKDYAFFIPKDAAGKKAIVQGVAYKEVLSVDMLKHYAEDAGKSKEEIAAITEPVEEYSFEAHGVIIK